MQVCALLNAIGSDFTVIAHYLTLVGVTGHTIIGLFVALVLVEG